MFFFLINDSYPMNPNSQTPQTSLILHPKPTNLVVNSRVFFSKSKKSPDQLSVFHEKYHFFPKRPSKKSAYVSLRKIQKSYEFFYDSNCFHTIEVKPPTLNHNSAPRSGSVLPKNQAKSQSESPKCHHFLGVGNKGPRVDSECSIHSIPFQIS